MAGRDAHSSSGVQIDLVDPVGRPFVPAGDLVVADFERLGVERGDLHALLLAHHLVDAPRDKAVAVQHEHRLGAGQAAVNQQAKPS